MGLLKKPMSFVDANVWIKGTSGTSHLGVTMSAKTPKVATGRTEQKTGGFTRKVSTGIFEGLEAEFEISEYSPAVMNYLSSIEDDEDVEILLKASLVSGGKKISYVATWKGLIEVEDGEIKAGENVSRKVKIDCTTAILVVNGYEEYRLKVNDLIAIIDGKDRYAELRKHIM